ncbi:DUF2339 domain-containing protein [Aneurinibacillus thermoaerophilus]|uniref:DUF2339 domain-containing protein n=1 Tax=Aneurinibacillus thermoaerophilus TaxID=143495 RepID=UPI002E242FAC|nr:DUF2339 domain-containing protein [Aneurinibacillus thermoaerophilus]
MDQEQRIAELEARVAQLERKIAALQPQKPTLTGINNVSPAVKSHTVSEKKEPTDWETLIGRVWLPRIFVIVLLVGIVWAFKASIDRGYITEPVRIVLGFIVSGWLLWMGSRQMKHQRTGLGQVLLGAAICIVILTTFAMHMLYGFIPASLAFPLNIIWIAGGVFLSYRHRSQALAVLSSLAGVFIPFLVESHNPNSLFFVAYEIALYVTFLYVAIRKQYLVLYYTSAALLQIVFFLFFIITGGEEGSTFAVGSIIQHAALLLFFLRQTVYMRSQTGMLFTTFVLTTVWLNIAFAEVQVEWMLLGIFVLYGSIAYALLGRNRKKAAVAISIASFALASYILYVLENENETIMILLEGTLALYLGIVLQSKLQQITGGLIYGLSLMVTIARDIKFVVSSVTFNWCVMLITAAWLYKLLKQKRLFKEEKVFRIMGVGYAFLLLVFLTEITGAVMREMSFEIMQLAISTVWALYAVAGILYGARSANKDLRRLGMALLIITLLKAIFFDLPFLSLLVRAVLFIGLGVIGLIVSRFFYTTK